MSMHPTSPAAPAPAEPTASRGRSRLAVHWPVYQLRLTTPRLTLQVLSDDDLPDMIEAILAGVHDPGRMPFGVPWTSAPQDELVLNSLRHHWESRSQVGPESWKLPFAVRRDGTFCGIQELVAKKLSLRKTVSTGSWLGLALHRQGIGTEMRAAVLQFAFDHLGATRAESGAFTDNPPSLGVSRALGYVPNGVEIKERRPGEVAASQRLVVTPETFARPDWTVQVTGLDACRSLLGLAPA